MSLLSILVALLFLSFLIFVHELAHFLAGKAVGIHAEVFSIGFGTPIVRFRRGRTEYRISMIPAGGYVKFPGEYSSEAERLEGEFHQAPVWKRAFVVAAGPASNLVLGFLIFWGLAMVGVPEKQMPPIGEVLRPSTQGITYWDDPEAVFPAEAAGLRPGDRILAVDGRRLESWEELTQEVMLRPEQPVELLVERNGEQLTVTVTPRAVLRGKMVIGQIGVAPRQELVLVREEEGGTLSRSPIRSVEGRPVYGPSIFADLLEAGRNQVQVETEDGRLHPVQIERWVETEDGARVRAVEGVPVSDLVAVRKALLDRGVPSLVRVQVELPDGTLEERSVRVELEVRVGGVDPDPPYPATLHLNDRLVTVNEIPVADYQRVHQELQEAAAEGRRVVLTFERERRFLFYRWKETARLEAPVTATEEGNFRIPGLRLRTNFAAGRGELSLGELRLLERMQLVDPTSGRSLAVEYQPPPVRRHGPISAIGAGAQMTTDTVEQMLSLLKRLVVGEVSFKYISGPVGIVNITQKTLNRGGWSWASLLAVLSLTAFISINLAVVNLLPIPIADGGQLLFFAFEAVRGQPLDARWQVVIQQISVLVLIGLFALVTLKDLVYW
ncbi:MAG: hypothetical protein KatS3mg115_1138 [Candidatus Poribacteria bacterium]|nr:MAG: hypothetical protein KatS3mg115_1138 [Candidatus Poribacteria bacterium]